MSANVHCSSPKAYEPTFSLSISSSSSSSKNVNKKKKSGKIDRKRLDRTRQSIRTQSALRTKSAMFSGTSSSLVHPNRRTPSKTDVRSETSYDSEDGGGEVILLADIPLVSDASSSSSWSSPVTRSNNSDYSRREKLRTYHVDFTGNITPGDMKRGRGLTKPDPPALDNIHMIGRCSTLTSCEIVLEQQVEGSTLNDDDSIEIGYNDRGRNNNLSTSAAEKSDCTTELKSVNFCGLIFHENKNHRAVFVITILCILLLTTAGSVAGLLIRDDR
jgi:hypothetical protein